MMSLDTMTGKHFDALPPPTPLANTYSFMVREKERVLPSESVVYLGGSLIDLGETELAEVGTEGASATRDFSLSYLPLRKGMAKIGGLRVLVLSEDPGGQRTTAIKEVDIVAEVWVVGMKGV
jgi:hypothetical protein